MRFESREMLAAYFWMHPGLTGLELINCPSLTRLPELPSTLICLQLKDCPRLARRGLRLGNLTILVE